MGNNFCQSNSFTNDGFLQMQLLHCSDQILPLKKTINNIDINELVKPYKFGNWDPAYGQSGLGVIYMPAQYYYQGGIRKGKPHGHGKIAWTNEDIYNGDVSDGKASGTGKLVCGRRCIEYSGDWLDGLPSKGVLTYNGMKIEVSFKKQRQVTIKLKDNTIYTGQIVKRNNQYHIEGKGKMIFIDGSYYEGHWKEGHMHGRGSFVWANDKKYEGDYHIGKKQGYGKYYFSKNNWYEGMWEDGKQHGQGTVYHDNEKAYSGRWCNGSRQKIHADN